MPAHPLVQRILNAVPNQHFLRGLLSPVEGIHIGYKTYAFGIAVLLLTIDVYMEDPDFLPTFEELCQICVSLICGSIVIVCTIWLKEYLDTPTLTDRIEEVGRSDGDASEVDAAASTPVQGGYDQSRARVAVTNSSYAFASPPTWRPYDNAMATPRVPKYRTPEQASVRFAVPEHGSEGEDRIKSMRALHVHDGEVNVFSLLDKSATVTKSSGSQLNIPPTPFLPRGLRPVDIASPSPEPYHSSGLLGASPHKRPRSEAT